MNWFFGKKKTKPRLNTRAPLTRKQKLLKLAQSNAYYSVSITRTGCKESSQLINKSFLFEDAPVLPLANCSADKCTCEYLGLLNRRKSQRRIKERRRTFRMGEDRRQQGRRKDEALWNKYGI